jgi:hypothetical protein
MSVNNSILEPYLLGCLIGDGGLHGNLTFASLDQDIIDRVNNSLNNYGYYLKKRSSDIKRTSEYSIVPKIDNRLKYSFIYNNKEYSSAELLPILQAEGYPVTSHDTLLSIVGCSNKTKKSTILKYFPQLKEITCKKLKADQHSVFLDLLTKLNLRVTSYKKRIPEIYFSLEFEDRLLLFQGLMDTDGCGSNHKLEFCVSNKELANDFLRLANSLGYSGKIHEKHPHYFSKKYNEYRYGHIAYRVLLNNITTVCPFLCERKIKMYNKIK